MKINVRILCTLFVCAFLSVNLFAQGKASAKDLVGNWSYTMDHPMEGPVKGNCEIAQKGDDVVATFKQEGETGNTTSPLRLNDNGKFYADMDSQGYTVTISFKPEGDIIKCEMDAGVISIPLDMKKVK